MARIDAIPREAMSEAQRAVHDRIGAGRSGGVVSGPFPIWLRMPALAQKAAELLTYLRRDLAVPVRLAELAVLVTARSWTAQYEWAVHEGHAVAAGIDPTIAAAIRERREPSFIEEDEAVVYALARELMDKRALSDATYARAVALLGEDQTVGLVTVIGFFAMVAVVLVAFEVEAPGGARPLAE
jgi:4-carboxymuconolactone decarboxylase